MSKKLVRNKFREAVFKRDNYKCKCCNASPSKEMLDAHHITDRNEIPMGGYVRSNGITLCQDCHLKAEVWHCSDHEEFWGGMHPDDLYKLIGSSLEQATADSLKLK